MMTFETVRAFFGWGALLNLIFLTLIFLFFISSRNIIYQVHSRWIPIPRETFLTVIYAGMAWYKLATFLLFVIPYCVLRFCV